MKSIPVSSMVKFAESMGQSVAGLAPYSSSIDDMSDSNETPDFHSHTQRYDPNSTMSKFHKNRDLQQYVPSGKDVDTIKSVTSRDSRLSSIQDRRLLDSHLRNR